MDEDNSEALPTPTVESNWVTTMNSVLETIDMADRDSENNELSQLDLLSHINHDHDVDHIHEAFDSSAIKSAAQEIIELKKLEQSHLKNLIETIEPLNFEELSIAAHELVNCSTNIDKKLPCANNAKDNELNSRKSQLKGEFAKSVEEQTLGLKELPGDAVSCDFDCDNPMEALLKIVAVKDFDPLAKQQQLVQKCIIKHAISLPELIKGKNPRINIQINKECISELAHAVKDGKQISYLNPLLDNIVVKHSPNEFLTFCLCETCKDYNESFFRIMADHFRASHMLGVLLNGLIKAYGSMLKNVKACNQFKKLISNNKKIWITTGFYYQQLSEHLNFVDHLLYSDQVIFVLFSSILMFNNPMLLLHILAFHVECIVKAFVEGYLEIVAPTQVTVAVKMLNYLLNGYDELMRIADQVGSSMFAFENIFLRKFHLTWRLLCQRMYRQHVYLRLADTMLACVITIKDLELTPHNAALIKRYIHFNDIMNTVDRLWSLVWWEINKYNLSEVECKRRKNSIEIFRIFVAVKRDSMTFELPPDVDANVKDKDLYNFAMLKDRRLIWYRILAYAKKKWSNEFYKAPNTLIVDSKCTECNALLPYHSEDCKCVTCCIGGSPLPPQAKELNGLCNKCATVIISEKEIMSICELEILSAINNKTTNNNSNVVGKRNKPCTAQTTDKDCNNAKEKVKDSNNTKQKVKDCNNIKDKVKDSISVEVGPSTSIKINQTSSVYQINELIQTKHFPIPITSPTESPLRHNYHISWAVFTHLNNRIKYPYKNIEVTYFCCNCPQPACQLAIKILNDEISLDLTKELLKYYQPIITTREELRALLPKIMLYHRKLMDVSINIRSYYSKMNVNSGGDDNVMNAHDYLVKIYWIFVVSIYATYFLKAHDNGSKSINLQYLQLYNGDIRVKQGKLRGNKKDKMFREFLSKIKSLPSQHIKSTDEVNTANLESQLNELLNMAHITENFQYDLEKHIPVAYEMMISNISNANRKGIELSDMHDCTNPKLHHKKMCKELRKCCFDHTDVNECLKEGGHANKKRIKKDCNHGRTNETRERLRKKLTKNVEENSRIHKATQTGVTAVPAATATGTATGMTSATESSSSPSTSTSISINKQNECCGSVCGDCTAMEKLKKSDSVAETMATKAVNTATATDFNADIPNTNPNDVISYQNKKPVQQQNENNNDNDQEKIVKGKENENHSNQSNVNPAKNLKSSMKQKETNANINKSKEMTKASNDANITAQKPPNNPISNNKKGITIADENCDTIDKYSNKSINDEQQWIKETLNYIEGSNKYQTNAGNNNYNNNADSKNGKMQPQTMNPKKAAKKAKQKQRKEEQKRIIELKELRAQFESIYFKEFTEKHLLKILKTNKKQQQRDKKRIALMEANIKNLQRAKAKVEANILELIATVKQTNTEFKFAYLPTKEQQLEKLTELEGNNDKTKSLDKSFDNNHTNENRNNHNGMVAELSREGIDRHDICDGACDSRRSDLNGRHEDYAIPYAQANHFPIQLNVLASATSAALPGLPRMPMPVLASSPAPVLIPTPDHHPFATTPYNIMGSPSVCYAPPPTQNQQLPPNVMAAMTSSPNAFNNNINNNTHNNNNNNSNASSDNIDPSKRIVTIRRVNLPNVSEPQVTVTARGSSPDKDKLLYTFINGQLVPTANENLNDKDLISTSLQEPKSAHHNSNIQRQQSIENNLSKAQIKKERRRLSKLQLMNDNHANPSSLHHKDAQQTQQICNNNKDTQGNPSKKKAKEEHSRDMEEKQIKKSLLKTKKNAPDSNADVTTNNYRTNTNHQDRTTKALNKSESNSSLSSIECSLHCEKSKVTNNSVNKNNQQPQEQQQKQQQQNNKKLLKKKRKVSTVPTTTIKITIKNNEDSDSSIEYRFHSGNQEQKQPKQNKHQKQCELPIKHQPSINEGSKSKTTKQAAGVAATGAVPKQQRSLSSSGTSCSAATTPSLSLSGNSVSSEINTRENSANSANIRKINQKHCTETTPLNHKTKNQLKNSTKVVKSEQNRNENKKQQQKQQQQSQLPINECHVKDCVGSCGKNNKQPKQINETKILEDKKSSNNNNKMKLLKNPSACPEMQSNANKSNKSPIIDNGQFDNNPFKSLHIQATDSDIAESTPSANEYECDHEIVETQQQKFNNAFHNNNKVSGQKKHLYEIQKLSNDNNCISNERAIGDSQHGQQTTQIKLQSKGNRDKSKKPSNEPEQHEQITTIGKHKKQKNKVDNGKALNDENYADNQTRSKNKYQLSENAIKQKNNGTELAKKQHRYNTNNDLYDIGIGVAKGEAKSSNTNNLNGDKKSVHNKKSKQKQTKSNQSNKMINSISHGINSLNLNDVTPPNLPAQSAALASTIRTTDMSHQHFANVWNGGESCGLTKYNTLDDGSCYPQQITSSNISIMDQLNRGVQVENLSLPPGITLTKVDPIKSEQLRQKSESIKKLAMPLQQQQLQQPMQAYHHHHHHAGATIIAPPVAPVTSYFGLPYGGGISNGVASTIDPQSGIIMVEANRPSSTPNVPAPSYTSTTSLSNASPSCNDNKQSKNKKRRNKSRQPTANTNRITPNVMPNVALNEPNNTCAPKMITLRNPMFHKAGANADGIAKPAATPILHQPSIGRSFENYSSPLDQPAAIIKNDNGMYTIRNPALHQAVTNGLALGGYCQFGNINYYTPQEVAAALPTSTTSPTTATITKSAQRIPQVAAQYKQQQQQEKQTNNSYGCRSRVSPSDNVAENFSYFSHDSQLLGNTSSVSAAANIDIGFGSNCGIYNNKIGINNTNIADKHFATPKAGTTNNINNRSYNNNGFNEYESEPSQVEAIQQYKRLSAIGSEMKNAQQQKQRKTNTTSQIWPLTTPDQMENVSSIATNSALRINDRGIDNSLNSDDMTLQQKYRQSKYFNGFDAYMPDNGASLYNHSCGDDSPPPAIDNYTSTYLDGIPNTGIIRYDNVSFLKNLMPGQNLNNEVSIHSVNNSRFATGTNNSATTPHRVEIKPIYGLQQKSMPSHGIESRTINNTQSSGPTTAAYLESGPLNYYHTTDTANINNVPKFSRTDDQTKVIHKPLATKYVDYQSSNQAMYRQSIESPDNHCSILNLKDMLSSKEECSKGSSSFLNENFMKSMNNLQISVTPSPNEQISQITGDKIISSSAMTATNKPNGGESANGNSSNSWW